MHTKNLYLRTIVLSLGYWFSATTFGLLAHPYKTMRAIVRRENSRALVYSPVVWGLFFWTGATVGVIFGKSLAQWLQIEYPRLFLSGLEWVFWWTMFFLGLWQVLIGYLYYRFRRIID